MNVAAIESPFPCGGGPVVTPLAERLSVGPSADVRSEDAWSEAGRKILGYHFGRVLTRVPGVVAGQDPEEVHAMRVAARRMRAAWRVFGDAYGAADDAGRTSTSCARWAVGWGRRATSTSGSAILARLRRAPLEA